ncbi:MAG: lauroyl acyltransferase [Alphaproteobacteria bacterium]|nr:lauroyl acyltransferase [Alphaproteobacteria bacterium]
MADSLARRLRYRIEAIAVTALFGLFGAMRPERASAIGGAIARTIGPLLPVSRRAGSSLARALPELGAGERARIVRRMWDNLGRVAGEYPHVQAIAETPGYVEIVGAENLDPVMGEGQAAILFSAHLANWEVFAASAHAYGLGYAQIERAPNNPLVQQIIRRMRNLPPEEVIEKGRAGARRTVEVLAKGGRLGLLVDQKLNEGIAVPFFGRPAMTAPALAQLARRFACPVIPVRIERLDGCRFRVTVYPAMTVPRSGDAAADALAFMTAVNATMESWIRSRPDQWLWLHRRWPEPA